MSRAGQECRCQVQRLRGASEHVDALIAREADEALDVQPASIFFPQICPLAACELSKGGKSW
jgi:hypothetical protein